MREQMNPMFILIPSIFFVLLTPVQAQDIYIYTHKNGNIVITNSVIPEDYKTKAQKAGSFKYAPPPVWRQREKSQKAQSTKASDPNNAEKEKKY